MVDQLREIPHVRQIHGEPKRRWFTSEFLDLMVWVNDTNKPIGFQFCHRNDDSEHALTWRADRGWDYAKVDTGEAGGLGIKATPILRPTGVPDLALLRTLFEAAAGAIPMDIRRFIIRRFAPKRRGRPISKRGKTSKKVASTRQGKASKKGRYSKKSKAHPVKKKRRK